MAKSRALIVAFLLVACGQGGRDLNEAGFNSPARHAPSAGLAPPEEAGPVFSALETLGLAYRVDIWHLSAGEIQHSRTWGLRGVALNIDVDGDATNGQLGADVQVSLSLGLNPLQLEFTQLDESRKDLALRVEVSLPEPDANILVNEGRRIYLGFDAIASYAPKNFEQRLLLSGVSLLPGEDALSLDWSVSAPPEKLGVLAGRYREEAEQIFDAVFVQTDLSPVPETAGLKLFWDAEGEAQEIQIHSASVSDLHVRASFQSGPVFKPHGAQNYALELHGTQGTLSVQLGEIAAEPESQHIRYQAETTLSAVSYGYQEQSAGLEQSSLQLALTDLPLNWELKLLPELGERPLQLGFSASTALGQLSLSQNKAQEELTAHVSPLPGELSICFADSAACGSHGSSTDASLNLQANLPLTLNYLARSSDGSVTEIKDLYVQELQVDFGSQSGFRKGYLYFDTNEYPFHAEIRDEDGSSGFFLRFSEGTYAQDRYVRWKNYVQIDKRQGRMVCPGREDLAIKAGGRFYDADFVVDALCQ